MNEESKVIMWVEVEPEMYQKREDALKYEAVRLNKRKDRTHYRINRDKPVLSKKEINSDGLQVVNIFIKAKRDAA